MSQQVDAVAIGAGTSRLNRSVETGCVLPALKTAGADAYELRVLAECAEF